MQCGMSLEFFDCKKSLCCGCGVKAHRELRISGQGHMFFDAQTCHFSYRMAQTPNDVPILAIPCRQEAPRSELKQHASID